MPFFLRPPEVGLIISYKLNPNVKNPCSENRNLQLSQKNDNRIRGEVIQNLINQISLLMN